MKEKISEMFQLQNKLNNESNGDVWTQGITNKGRTIDWNLCILQETSELINSFNWKHWKNINGQPDWQNAKIELVDIWHFIMSSMLSEEQYEDFDKIINDVISSMFKNNYYVEFKTEEDKIKYIIRVCKYIMNLSSSSLENIIIIKYNIDNFLQLCHYCDLSFDELYKLYIGKNALNKFRQDNGYKEGSYIKIWNGKEDNVVMQQILQNNSEITYDGLLLKLSEEYSFVLKLS